MTHDYYSTGGTSLLTTWNTATDTPLSYQPTYPLTVPAGGGNGGGTYGGTYYYSQGWSCSKCHRAWGPTTTGCLVCNQEVADQEDREEAAFTIEDKDLSVLDILRKLLESIDKSELFDELRERINPRKGSDSSYVG